jgi:hypothetical protein
LEKYIRKQGWPNEDAIIENFLALASGRRTVRDAAPQDSSVQDAQVHDGRKPKVQEP